MQKKTQRGNVLFLILIAVALFAALSFAVTSSMRGGGEASEDTSLLETTPLVQYATQMKYTVDKLMLLNGCDETELSFHTTSWPPNTSGYPGGGASDYINPNAPSDNSCHVFHEDGGGLPWIHVTDKVVNSIEFQVSGNWGVNDLGGNLCADVELLFLAEVTEEMCVQINDKNDVENPGGRPPLFYTNVRYGMNYQKFDGFYGCGNIFGYGVSPNASQVSGHPTACFEDSDGRFNFFHALIER